MMVRERKVPESMERIQQRVSTNSATSAFSKSPVASRQHMESGISHSAMPPLDFDTPLNTVTEKQAFLDEAMKRPAPELMSAWKEQLVKTNYAQLDFVEVALANKIKDNPDSDEAKQ